MQSFQGAENRKRLRLNKITIILLLILFTLSFLLRLYVSRDYNFRFADDKSYFHIREIKYIKQNFKPFFYDKLSFSGHTISLAPGFDYLLALFLIFFNESFVFNIIPKILPGFVILLVYLITLKMTRNKTASFFSAISAFLMPAFFGLTTNSVTPLSFSMILTLCLIYYFIDIRTNDKSLIPYLIVLTLCIFTTTFTLAIILSMLLYILFLRIEKFKKIEKEFEVTVFSLIPALLVFSILFKKVILINGYSVLIGNIPKIFLFNYINVNPLNLFYLVGLFPLLMSIYIFYKYLFNKEGKKESRTLYLFFSIIVVVLVLGSANILAPSYLLITLGITFAIVSGFSYNKIISGLKKTKFGRYRKAVSIFLFLLLLSNIPLMISYSTSLLEQSPSKGEIELMGFIKENTEKNSVILSKLYAGNIITCLSERKNVIDTLFLGVTDTKKRLLDVNKVYTGISEVEALKVMNKYGVDYIIYDDEKPLYIKDRTCFEPIYSKGKLSLYKVKCEVE